MNDSKKNIYEEVHAGLKALLGSPPNLPFESGLCSLIALLKEKNRRISWVGFYRESPESPGTLFVGPYQGKTACVEIPPGRGVCGSSFQKRKTEIVPDVEKFPGHIACDALSRSEIVVPLHHQGKCIGVLDLDSHEIGAFDASDEAGLLGCLKLIEELR